MARLLQIALEQGSGVRTPGAKSSPLTRQINRHPFTAALSGTR